MRFWLTVEILSSAAALTMLVVAASVAPDPSGYGSVPSLFPPCDYRQATGEPCLSCGMTTAYVNMIHGQPVVALRANPAGVALFLLTALTPLWMLHAAITRRDPFRFNRHPLGRLVIPAVVLVIIGVWLARSSYL